MTTSSPLLRPLALDELQIDDEHAFRHVGLYGKLKSTLRRDGIQFAVCDGGIGRAQLLNLAFWRPGDMVEVLPEPFLVADQVMHNAWHVLVASALGSAASSRSGLLLAESVASAFDVYLIGRLIGHAPNSDFLASQVPVMREAAEEAGMFEAEFESLLRQFSDEPEASFEQFRQLLFDLSRALVEASDVEAAAQLSQELCSAHPMGALVHHYELPTWVLQARAAQETPDDRQVINDLDRALREAQDAVQWLEDNVVDAILSR